jgi:hypothetical protein
VQVERETDKVARLVVLKVSGELGDRDLLSLADELENASEVEPDFALLIDLRRADGRTVTGVQALARQPLLLSPESRRAVVVPSELGFGMARMYELLRQQAAPRVFRDYAEADRWVRTGNA